LPEEHKVTATPRRRMNQFEISAISGPRVTEQPKPITAWAMAKVARLPALAAPK
jgi:hypothetical protein